MSFEKLSYRFWDKVLKTDKCWLWTAGISSNGYGSAWFRGRHYRAHRLAYVEAKGTIPEGLELDHLCRNRLCVNPDHMEPVTHRENILRGESFIAKNAKRQRCIRGHKFSKRIVKGQEKRVCLICDNVFKKAWAEANPEKINESRKKWDDANCGYKKKYYEANRNRLIEYKKAWYQANREHVLERVKAHYKANPDYKRNYRAKKKELLNVVRY
jgi:hypothetical protein